MRGDGRTLSACRSFGGRRWSAWGSIPPISTHIRPTTRGNAVWADAVAQRNGFSAY